MKELTMFGLVFKDRDFEEEYMSSHANTFRKRLAFLIIAKVLQMTAVFLINPRERVNFEISNFFPFVIPLGAILMLSIWIRVKRPAFCEEMICILILTCSIITSEYLTQCKRDLVLITWTPFILGSNLELDTIYLFLSNIKWMNSVIIILFTQIYTFIRALDLISEISTQKLALCSLCIHLLLTIVTFRLGEREKRFRFQNERYHEKQAESLEKIIIKNIPNEIIFMKQGEVLLYNESMKKNFNVSTSEEILEVLHKIKIKPKLDFDNVVSEKNFSRKDKLPSLYELYKDCEFHSQETKQLFWPGFNTVEGELENIFPEKNKTFSIQLGSGVWKDREGVLIIMNETTEIKNYYKSLDGYKDNLLATVSHDLRAPLNGILGMLGLLLEETEEQAKREKINISIVSAKLLQNMINDILDFTLISKGKLKLKFETTNVNIFLEETLKIMSVQAKMKGISLELENHLPLITENHILEQNRLRQVLLNLIGNAIKFTSRGRVCVRVREVPPYGDNYPGNSKFLNSQKLDEIKEESFLFSLKKLNDKDRLTSFNDAHMLKSSMMMARKKLIFEVEDTGVGIKQDDICKLFKMFSRVTAGHDSNMNGIGLGLAISQSLVIMMNNNRSGAVIGVNSTYGQGSKFSFPLFIENEPSEYFKEILDEKYNLPLFFDAKPSHVDVVGWKTTLLNSEGDSLIYQECKSNKKVEILIVDDDQINLLVVTNYLKSEADQISFHTSVNGEDALEKIKLQAQRNFYFDVILMDCLMPILDGYEAAKILKAMMKTDALPWAPIVALTANNTPADKQKCQQCGMDLFLTKPFMKSDLLKIIFEARKLNEKLTSINKFKFEEETEV